MATATKLLSVDYQVFGKVQGVFFRKFTRTNAKQLGLVGSVMNTDTGTVTGTFQGQEDKVKQMKTWLSTTGSPQSKIERCEFTNEHKIEALEYRDFTVIESVDRVKTKSSNNSKKSTLTKTTTTSKSTATASKSTMKSSVTTAPTKK